MNTIKKIRDYLRKVKSEKTPAQIAKEIKIHPSTSLRYCLYGEELGLFKIDKKILGKNTIHFITLNEHAK